MLSRRYNAEVHDVIHCICRQVDSITKVLPDGLLFLLELSSNDYSGIDRFATFFEGQDRVQVKFLNIV